MNRYRMRNFIPSLTLIVVGAVVMSLFRPYLSGTNSYIWMNWNLFLALLPLAFAWLYSRGIGHKYVHILWILLWLAFLPNAPYMLTDFIHIADIGPKDILWYDGLMLFGFAWAGILAWIHSVIMIYEKISSRLFIPVISLLTAYGMYLGRYIRFNSWDFIHRPAEVLDVIGGTFIHPLDHQPFLLFTTVFWVFLMCSYVGYTHLHKIQSSTHNKSDS